VNIATLAKTETLFALVAHYKALERLDGWTITSEYVADLPCWGRCLACVDNRTAHIEVRDPRVPLALSPSSRGDIEVEIRETIAHELMHCWTSYFGTREPASVAVEENMVWALSSALVAAETSGTDVRALQRALTAIPAAARMRVTALAKRGNRRNRMDPKMIEAAIAALSEGDGAAALEILKGLLVAGASAGVEGAHPEPEAAAKDPTPGEPGAGEGYPAREDPEGAMMRRVLGKADVARSRATLRAIEADGVASLIMRARNEGVELPAALEQEIKACSTRTEAERMLRVAMLAREGGTQQRERSGVKAPGAPAPDGSTAGEGDVTGLPPAVVTSYRNMRQRDPKAADIYLKSARAATKGN
jgi:hypothetical protein